MTEEKKPLIKVDVGSPISIKAEIKTEIPKESSGRLIDALTDMLRPFTESRGLRADQIRLQREEVLIEIAKRAKQRLSIEGSEPQQVPTKFLIPFLEKASLEDDRSGLVDAWANLLVTASESYNSSLLRHISVLAELSAREVQFLDKMIKSCRADKKLTFIRDAPGGFSEWWISTHLSDFLRDSRTKKGRFTEKRIDIAMGKLINEVEVPGGLLMAVGVEWGEVQHPQFKVNDSDDDSAIAILQSLGLVRKEIITARNLDTFCFAECLHLTQFGLNFCIACDPGVAKILKDEDEEIAAQEAAEKTQ